MPTRRSAPLCAGVVMAMVAALPFAGAQTQDDDARYRETYAIAGARIEIGDGKVIEKGSVVVRNGRIQAVGANLRVPAYARVIKGDGLTVYPGFIDGYTTKGLKLPDWKPDQDAKPDRAANAAITMREANRKGARPELMTADHLDLTEQALIDERKAGFTTALIAPSGGIFNGPAVLLNLSGRPAREAVLGAAFGQAIGFSAPGDGYPATPLGVMAFIRQAFYDAEAARLAGRSGSLPYADKTLLALQPLLQGQTPALIDADRGFEIARALSLAERFKLKLIVVGGAEAYKHADELKRRGVPLILSLAFGAEPKPAKKDPPAKTPSLDKPEADPAAAPKQEEKKTDDPTEVPSLILEERQVKWLERVRTAKTLSEKGVPFAFASRGTRNRQEFWKNLRRAIAEGLPRHAALRALTIDAARVLGLEKDLGSIEVGKRANLTVMSGDFVKEDAKVRYMIIGDRLFEPETDRPQTGPPRNPFDEEDHHEGGSPQNREGRR